MSKLIISTTPTLENAQIVKYCGVVTSNVVLGVNMFSDFTASLSDVFGGHSNTYREKLEILYGDVIRELESKARALSANAIVGLSVDFDEISGKGKQMFMATAKGTACLAIPKSVSVLDNDAAGVVSSYNLERKVKSKIIINFLRAKIPARNFDWDYVLTHNMSEIAKDMAEYWIYFVKSSDGYEDWVKLFYANIITYFSTLDVEVVKDALYPFFVENHDMLTKHFNYLKLFDANRILTMLKDGHVHEAIKLLRAPQPEYTREDANTMKAIIEFIDNLPDVGKIEVLKEGLFSKTEVEKFVCCCSNKNDKDTKFCTACGKNIKGLDADEVKTINYFKIVVESLEQLLK